MYTCIQILHPDRQLLVDTAKKLLGKRLNGFLFQTPKGEPLPHHMTINMGSIDPQLNDPNLLWSDAILTIDAIFLDAKRGVCAARVRKAVCDETPIQSANADPHVTICLMQGVNPATSNIINWNDKTLEFKLEDPLVLKGVIRECE